MLQIEKKPFFLFFFCLWKEKEIVVHCTGLRIFLQEAADCFADTVNKHGQKRRLTNNYKYFSLKKKSKIGNEKIQKQQGN